VHIRWYGWNALIVVNFHDVKYDIGLINLHFIDFVGLARLEVVGAWTNSCD